MRRPGVLTLLALVLAAGCAGGGSPASHPAIRPTATHRSPFAGVHGVVERYMRRRLPGVPVARLRVDVSTLRSLGGSTETVLATATGRLGRPPGTAWVALGQRALRVARRGGRLVVAADVSRSGPYSLERKGAVAMPPGSRFHVARRAVVVSAPDVPAADVAEVAAVTDRELPGLVARYRLPHHPARAPVIFLVDSWPAAEAVAGVPMPHEAVGAEYQGLVYVEVPAWARIGTADRDALLVHELTHVASRSLVHGGPLSLIEGVARYEEQRYAVAAGAGWPYRYLADAYRSGYPSLVRWRWASEHWMLHRALPTWLAYEDGAAMVRAVLRDGGVAGLRRLAASFQHDRRQEPTQLFTAAQVEQAFRAGTGRSFAAVAAQARAETIAAADG